ncbi:hypothetical protein L1M59_30700 [Bacillus sp. ET1]|nr:hypothetical protein [Bacillus sp. ET1]
MYYYPSINYPFALSDLNTYYNDRHGSIDWSIVGSGGGGGASGFPGSGGLSVGSPPGKKGFENLLFKLGRKEPYTYECWWKAGPIKTKGFCNGWKTKVTGFYVGFHYPSDINPLQEQLVLECSKSAIAIATGTFQSMISSGNLIAALAAVPTANNIAQRTLRECLFQSKLPNNIVHGTTIGIFTKRLD